MATMNTTEVKRARPQLTIYTVLLVVALLMALFGAGVIAKLNMDATGSSNPFDAVPGGR